MKKLHFILIAVLAVLFAACAPATEMGDGRTRLSKATLRLSLRTAPGSWATTPPHASAIPA